MPKFRVEFPDTTFAPQELEAELGLSEQLHIANSPVLFGCRTGICGTCLVSVDPTTASGTLPADPAEREVLDMIADHDPYARLACQIKLKGDLKLRVLEENS